MTTVRTPLWIDQQDDPTRAYLLGGQPAWDDRGQTVIEGLRDTTWDLSPQPKIVIRDVGHGLTDVDLRTYINSAEFVGAIAPSQPTQLEVIGDLEVLRDRLELSAETMGRLLGAKVRRYHHWVSGEPMPLARVNAAAGAVAAVAAVLSEDPTLAKRIFDTCAQEATALIATGRFVSWKALVNRVRAEQAKERQALVPALPIAVIKPEGMTAAEFAQTLKSAAFRAATAILERLAPQTRATEEVWRVAGFADLDATWELRADGEELPETWSFLATMTGAGLGEFRERAEKVLGDPTATVATWESFVADEGIQAWDAYEFAIAGPVEEAAAPDGPAMIEGLLEFANLGIDLSTGERRG